MVVNMRLDKFLKVSRIIKRRTVANELCDAKHVNVNGRVARASLEVKPQDIIEISFGGKITKYKILVVNEYANKETAGDMYEILS